MATAAARQTGGSVRVTLWILLIVYIFNFIDRQIVNILAEPIRLELGLSDTQIGLMTGLAFALFYTILGLPIARFSDRPTTHRPKLIAAALATWSAMTALCGMAQNFVQLLLARIGVGIGEAGCTPPAHCSNVRRLKKHWPLRGMAESATQHKYKCKRLRRVGAGS